MTPPAVRFFHDYVDPASYLLERILAERADPAALVVERVPFEVNAPPAPLVDPLGEPWRSFWEGAAAMAAEEGVALAAPRLIPWTRKAHELALHALEEGRAEAVRADLFRSFLVEGRDVGRVDVLLEVAARHGLDVTAAKAVLDVDRHTAAVEEARADAERLGVRGVPTLLSAHGMLEGFRGRTATLAFLESATR